MEWKCSTPSLHPSHLLFPPLCTLSHPQFLLSFTMLYKRCCHTLCTTNHTDLCLKHILRISKGWRSMECLENISFLHRTSRCIYGAQIRRRYMPMKILLCTGCKELEETEQFRTREAVERRLSALWHWDSFNLLYVVGSSAMCLKYQHLNLSGSWSLENYSINLPVSHLLLKI